ncbi:hypothetical protein K3495_g1457 [Podosphaera aphanis]|nr:hypothetical protein K3495_g1457 [Podosphaera aphanis]
MYYHPIIIRLPNIIVCERSAGFILFCAIAANARILIRSSFASNAVISGAPLFQILIQPCQNQFPEFAVARILDALDIERRNLAPLLCAALAHVHKVRRPLRQIIQNVRGVDNGALACRGLLLEESEKVAPTQKVQIDGDLIQEQDAPWPDQAHGQLDATTFPVGHSVHTPIQIDVEHANQLILAVGVVIAADGLQELPDADVSAHDRIQDPLKAEIGDALEAVFEGVEAADADGIGGREPFAREQAEQRRLTGSIGADKEGPRPRWQRERQVRQTEGTIREGEGQIGDGNGRRGGLGNDGRHSEGWWRTKKSMSADEP